MANQDPDERFSIDLDPEDALRGLLGGKPDSQIEFGCDYCADDQNRWYGHVTQIASDEQLKMLLLRCPRCGALYEDSPSEGDRTRRLTEDQAKELFPEFRG